MKVIQSLSHPFKKPVALTIGTFDGFHLGHQAVIAKTLRDAQAMNGEAWVLTYSNHPIDVLKPGNTKPLLTSIPQKLALLQAAGVDGVILLEFTLPFSRLSPEEFLKQIPLKALVLGYDSRIGMDRTGDEPRLRAFAKEHGFSLDYLEPVTLKGETISSSKIRSLIEAGDLKKAEEYLGRPYTISLPVQSGKGIGKQIGVHTANLDIQNVCIPPLGVWAVSLQAKGKRYPAVANLGFAPTVRDEPYPQLEVHAIGEELDLFGEEIEVSFIQYLRPEKKFSGIEELKAQIKLDIEDAQRAFAQDPLP